MSHDIEFPDEIRVEHGRRSVRYRCEHESHARPDDAERAEVPGYSLQSGPPSDPAHRPVYRTEKGDIPVVPTGRIHLRSSAPEVLEKLRPLLAENGFVIESVPTYAPHTAWITPVEGGVRYALNHWGALSDLEGVEHVEPQLLRPVSRR